MQPLSNAARLGAALIALSAWTGLGVQFSTTMANIENGNALFSIWRMLLYFTIITNLIVAVVMTSVALGRRELASPMILGGVTLAIALVGVIYGLLLSGMYDLSAGAQVADFLNHKLTPLLVPIWWLAFAPKGGLRMGDPPLWAILPAGYFVYGLLRGSFLNNAPFPNYPYPFMNLATLGWGQTLLNAVLIAAGFMVAGYLLVLLDGWLARRVARAIS